MKKKTKGVSSMELTYREENGYRIPNLTLPDEPEVTLGKYGLMRRRYLKSHKKGTFSRMLMSGELNPHLMEIERTAYEQMEHIVTQMAAAQGVTEELKASDMMEWVGKMNNIRHSAEETILAELIYA